MQEKSRTIEIWEHMFWISQHLLSEYTCAQKSKIYIWGDYRQVGISTWIHRHPWENSKVFHKVLEIWHCGSLAPRFLPHYLCNLFLHSRNLVFRFISMHSFILIWIIWIIFVTTFIWTRIGSIQKTNLEVSINICMIRKNITLIE